MRTVSPSLLALIKSRAVATVDRLEIENPDGVFVDMTNLHSRNWLRSFDMTEAIDQLTASYSATLAREDAGHNLPSKPADFVGGAGSPWGTGSPGFTTITAKPSYFGTGYNAYEHRNDNLAGSRSRSQVIGTWVAGQWDVASAIVENVDALTTDLGLYDATTSTWIARVLFTWSTKVASLVAGTGEVGAIDLGRGRWRIWVATGSGVQGNSRRVYIYPTGTNQNALATTVHHLQVEPNRRRPSAPILDVGKMSLAPAMTASAINRNAAGSYREFLKAGKKIRHSVAYVSPDHHPLTNVTLDSENITTASWGQSTMVTRTMAAVGRDLVANGLGVLTESNDGAGPAQSHVLAQNWPSLAITPGRPMMASIDVRARGRTRFAFYIAGGTGSAGPFSSHRFGVNVDLTALTTTPFLQGDGVLEKSRIISRGNGLYTIEIVGTLGLTVDRVCLVVRLADATGGVSYIGDGRIALDAGFAFFAPDTDKYGEYVRTTSAAGSPWQEIFTGYIDGIDSGNARRNEVRVSCRDLGARVLQKEIETEVYYANAGAPALETFLQTLLDDNLGPGAVSLYTPVSPATGVTEVTIEPGKLLERMRDIALSIGWDLRYRYDAAGVSRLTLFEPQRSKTVPDATLETAVLIDVPKHEKTRADVVNRLRLRYRDGTSNVSTDVIREDLTSQGEYGPQFASIDFGQQSTIDTATEANAVADKVIADLSQPWLNQEAEVYPLVFFAQIGDLIGYPSDDVIHDVQQDLGVIGISHSGTPQGSRTRLVHRGKVTGAFYEWRRRFDDGIPGAGDPIIREEVTRTSVAGVLTLNAEDPHKRITSIEFRTREGAGGAWSAWIEDVSIPYQATVPLVRDDTSAIEYRVTGYRADRSHGVLVQAVREYTGAFQGTVEARARLISSTATQATYQVDAVVPPGATGTPQVTLIAITGSATLASGPSIGVASASGTQWTFNRGAAEGPDGEVQFRATLTGYQSDDDFKTIPAQGRDTIALDVRAAPYATDPNYIEVDVTVTDPLVEGVGSYITLTVDYIGLAAVWEGGISRASGYSRTVAPGVAVRYKLDRASYRAGMGRAVFRANAANRGTDSDPVDVASIDATNAVRLRVEQLSTTDTASKRVRVYAIDPAPQGLNSITLTYQTDGTGGVTPASGQTTGTPTTDFATTGYVDFTITRPAAGASKPGRVTFVGTAANRGMGSASVDVEPAAAITRPLVWAETIAATRTSETVRFWGRVGTGAGSGAPSYRYRTTTGTRSPGAWSAYAAMTDNGDGTYRADLAVTRDKFWIRLVEVQVRDADNRESHVFPWDVPPELVAIDETTGRGRRGEPKDDGHYDWRSDGTDGVRGHQTNTEFGGKEVRRLLAKALAADADNVDSVPDGTTYGRPRQTALTSGEIDLGKAGVINRIAANILRQAGGTALNTILANITDASHAGSGMQESGGKVINRLYAKALAADADNHDSLADGTSYGRLRIAGRTVLLKRRPSSGTQLLFNPGFEDGSDFWSSGTGRTFVSDAAKAYSGNRYLEISGTVQTTSEQVDEMGVARWMEVNPGDVLEWGGAVYREVGDGNCRMVLCAADKDKLTPVYTSATNGVTGSWTNAVGSYTVPAGKKFVRVYCEIVSMTVLTTARFDDVYLKVLRNAADLHGGAIRSGVTESGSKTINRLLAKALAADADNLDYVPDGTAKRRVNVGGTDASGNLDLGGTAWVNKHANNLARSASDANPVFSSIQQLAGNTGHALGSFQESGGKAVNRLLAKALAADSDNIDFVPDGTTYGRPKQTALTVGEIDLAKAGVIGKFAPNIKRHPSNTTGLDVIIQHVADTGHAGATMQESGGKPINRLFAKSLAADLDNLDYVADGTSKRRVNVGATDTSGNINFGGSAWTNRNAGHLARSSTNPADVFTIINQLTDGGHAASGMQESGGKPINRLLAKALAADADNLDSLANGLTYARTHVNALDAGYVDLSKIGVINKYAANIARSSGDATAISAIVQGLDNAGDVKETTKFAGVQGRRYVGSLTGIDVNDNPEFAKGLAGYTVYDNGGSGSITLSIVDAADNPNSTGKRLQIAHTNVGTPSPGHGGFYVAFGVDSGAYQPRTYHRQSTYLVRLLASIPVGYSVGYASNDIGTGSAITALTDMSGTGGWRDYVWEVRTGATGTFSSTGFWYIAGGTRPVTWHVAALNFMQLEASQAIDRLRRSNGNHDTTGDIIAGAVGRDAANVLVNGGGQEGPVGISTSAVTQQAQGWTYSSGANLAAVVGDSVNGEAHIGDRYLRIYSNDAARDNFSYQDFAVVAGDVYRVHGFIRISGAMSGTGQGAVINVDGVSGAVISGISRESAAIGEAHDCGVLRTAAQGVWNHVSSTFRIAVGGTLRIYCQLGYSAGIQGIADFDGVTLVRLPTVPNIGGKRGYDAIDSDGGVWVPAATTVKVGAQGAPGTITKTLFFPGTDFNPEGDIAYTRYRRWIHPHGTTIRNFIRSLLLPRGVTITAVRLHAYRAAGADEVSLYLYRLAATGGTETYLGGTGGTGAAVGTGNVTTSASFSEAVGASYYYTLECAMRNTVNNGDASLMYAEVDYTMPSYDKAY